LKFAELLDDFYLCVMATDRQATRPGVWTPHNILSHAFLWRISLYVK
jgi:hypothetical protein